MSARIRTASRGLRALTEHEGGLLSTLIVALGEHLARTVP